MSENNLIAPEIILQALIRAGSSLRRTIAREALIDLKDSIIAAEFDKQIKMLRESGCIACTGQIYSLTARGAARAFQRPLILCGIVTQGATHAVLMTDEKEADEVYRRMQIHGKPPASFLMRLKADDLSALPVYFRPGYSEPEPMPAAQQPVLPRILHTVRLITVPRDNRIAIIKAIREVTSLGLKEAKDIVDACSAGDVPIISDKVMTHDVERIIKIVAEAGGTAHCREQDAVPAVQMIHNVHLKQVDPQHKIPTIRVVRQHTGLDLIQAKTLVEQVTPAHAPFLKEMLSDAAQRFSLELAQYGGALSWDPAQDRPV